MRLQKSFENGRLFLRKVTIVHESITGILQQK